MIAIVSTYFRMIAFPHKGAITVINQLSFFASSSQVTGSIMLVHASQLALQNTGVVLFKDSSLMGTFSLLPPAMLAEIAKIETCHMISSTSSDLRKITNDSEVDMMGEFLPPSLIKLT